MPKRALRIAEQELPEVLNDLIHYLNGFNLMSASAGKQTFRTFNSNVRFILKADVQNFELEW